jgi:hypothetical protein
VQKSKDSTRERNLNSKRTAPIGVGTSDIYRMVPKKSRETIPLKEVSECDMISFFFGGVIPLFPPGKGHKPFGL